MASNVHAQILLPQLTCSVLIVGLSSSPSKSDPFSMDPFQSTFPSSKVSIYMYEFLGNLSSVHTSREFRFAVSSFFGQVRFRSRKHEVLGCRVRCVTSSKRNIGANRCLAFLR